jgi:3-methyl-2-oxobutanoate hydroxymethyltransferase
MGHLGLTPQSVHSFGGWKLQGKTKEKADIIETDAKKLEDVGVFSLVLEMIPNQLSTKITKKLNIPTIGIGAGPGTSGQVLVLQDILGLSKDFNPTFARKYVDGYKIISEALNKFDGDVKIGDFPKKDETF